jgi:apolipoprotein N-acyltransferase
MVTSAAPKLAPPSDPSPAPASRPRRDLLLAALSGLLYVAAFPGYGLWPLAFVAFVPVALAVRGASVRRAVALGALAGFTSHLGGYYWISHMLQVFAGLPSPVAFFGFLLVAAAQGASFGAGLGLAHWLGRRRGWGFSLTLPVGLVAMDFAYPLIFPSYVANTLFGATWLSQSAELWGVLGLTAIIGAVNGALADALVAQFEGQPRPRRTLMVAGALLAFVTLYGAVRTRQVDAEIARAEKLKVGLVQTNVGGFENVQGYGATVRRYVEGTRALNAQGAQLVVWPEGALRGTMKVGANIRETVLGGLSQPLAFGATRVDRDATGQRVPYNSAFLADAEGRVVGSYDKSVLLVFGEYIPLGETFPKFYEWLPMASHWGRGRSTAPLVLGDWRLGTFICYEDILPRFVQGIMQPTAGRRPDVMLNLTNDSWYGDTVQPIEHLALASFRAIEHRRALVRSTNTGISALVDPAGRVVAKTNQYREETLLGEVPRMAGETPYQRVGDVVGWAALLLLASALPRRRAA